VKGPIEKTPTASWWWFSVMTGGFAVLLPICDRYEKMKVEDALQDLGFMERGGSWLPVIFCVVLGVAMAIITYRQAHRSLQNAAWIWVATTVWIMLYGIVGGAPVTRTAVAIVGIAVARLFLRPIRVVAGDSRSPSTSASD
jgi:hypothetical protein